MKLKISYINTTYSVSLQHVKHPFKRNLEFRSIPNFEKNILNIHQHFINFINMGIK